METVIGFLNKLANKGVKLSVEAGQLNCYVQKGMLTADIKDGITRYKSEIIALLVGREEQPSTHTHNGLSNNGLSKKTTEFPLSARQKRLYILQKMHPGMSAYNVPLCFKVNGEVDAGAMAKAWDCVLEQFPILTAHVIEREGELYHRLESGDKATIRQQTIDCSGDEKLLEVLRKQVKEPFDLNRGPLARIGLFLQDSLQSVLLLTFHHVVFDGASGPILLRSLLEFYRQAREGKPLRLAHDRHGYQEFVAWENAMLVSPEGAAHASYWQQQLNGELPAIELLPNLPRLVPPVFEAEALVAELPKDSSQWVRDFCKEYFLTPAEIFLALFQLLLHRYTKQDDIIVGMPVMERVGQKFAGEIGNFVNIVPIRTHCEKQFKLGDFLRRVQCTVLDAFSHSAYPFPLILDGLKGKEAEKNPVFQVTYSYQNLAEKSDLTALLQQQGLSLEKVPEIVQEEDSDLALKISERDALFSLCLKYNPELYPRDAISRFLGHYFTLLTEISKNFDLLLHEYPIVAEQEKYQLLVGYNDTRAEYPKDGCLHELFVGQVGRHADATAIVCGEEALTYQELYERSQNVALYLQSQGVKPDSLVGVCMERSVDMVVGLLGILQAGGAYVPLDPNHPEERLAYMLEDSRATIVLTQEALQEKLGKLIPSDTQLMVLDRQRAEISDRVEELKAKNIALAHEVKPHHLAYVIYTSGSTGKPKGVAIEHHSPVTLVHWASEVYSREELAGVLAATSICFDLSVYEIFVTLANGGTIFLVANALGLVHLAQKESVTLINTVPSAMEELVRIRAIPDSVQTINLAGEPLSAALVDKIYDNSRVKKVYDLYGPSEDTTYSTYILRKKHAPQSIGRPIANTQVYILDAYNQLQPIGVPGELHIAGDGLARGYLNRAELTQEKFVANPFEPGTRMYKTGDLARWLDDGNIQYLGRIDTQVKIRGFRIETGEIEARLNEYPEIQESAVIVQGEESNKHLIAFYKAKGSTGENTLSLSKEGLREHLLQTLPEYMVPAAFVSLAAIPLNPNGKVDRCALSRMDVSMESGQEYEAPRSETEKQLVEIWAQVLKLAPEKIGIHDNFFELGGHSLLATQLISKIRSQMNVDLPLKVLFENRSIAQLVSFIATAEKSNISPVRSIDRTQFERLPLSFAQERLWILDQLSPGNVAYSLPVIATVSGELDVHQLEQAFNHIIARHENLRTVFPSIDGQAQQVILESVDFKLERMDLSHYETVEARDQKAKEICQAEAAAPFDLAQGPLFRGKVIKLAEQEHILMLNMNHIISDGWSFGVLIKELSLIMEAYRQGREPELAPLPIQYVDYSVWQRSWLEDGGVLKQQLTYWKEKLAGVPESIDLATDYPRPSIQSFAGATYTFALDGQLTQQLKTLAERHGSTLYMTLLAAFKVLLHRYTGQNDLCVGSPIANRQYGETEGLIGMFINTLALRSQVEGDDTFSAFLSQVKATCLEAYEHQDTPFEKVVDMLRSKRNLAISPIFQVMVILQNADMGALDQRFPLYSFYGGISKIDLTAEFTETTEGMTGSIEYSTALYRLQTIHRMAEHFTALCRAITATPTARIRDLDYISDSEKRQLLVGYNDTRAEYPKDKCIHQLFAEQVAIQPEETAVVFGKQSLSYQELYTRSCDLALYLQSLGVKPDSLVGLCLERSLDMMVGIMGIVQAGGAYMPADPDYPDDRLAYMLQNSQAAIVLTQEKFRNRIGALLIEGAKLIALDKQWPEISKSVADLRARNVALRHEVKPHNVNYVIYTSGSTGKPKGVQVEHQALVNRIHWMQKRYPLQQNDVVLQKTPYSFDVSVWEFFWPMMAGASIVFAAPDGHKDVDYLEILINQANVTTLHYVPSMLRIFLEHAQGKCDCVKQIFCSGEALDKKSVEDYKTKFPNAVLHNLYGPTEAAIDVTAYDCSQLQYPFVPIGAPIDNTQIYILDAYNQLQPIGVPGELHIAGDGLARGYLNRAELTQEKFVANPFEPGTRMYKTGDLARWLDDGNIQYLGRIDTQVKIRGFRIETGEIEARLNEYPEIQESAVIVQGEESNKHLIAFYKAKGSTGENTLSLSKEGLREHLLQTLPEYMVPAAFVSLAAIPLNPNGKVDRCALSRMDVSMESGQEYEAPRSETEKQLVEIWAQVLKLAPEKIGIHDNFFELGGHSLLATQLISKIRSQMNVDLPLKVLFERTSIAHFAELVAGAERRNLPAIRPVDRTKFERLPLSFAQERVWFIHQLEPGSAGYNLSGAFLFRGKLNISQLEQAFNHIIARHENLRTVFPSIDGQAQQVILESVDFKLERMDLSHYETVEARDQKAKEICQAEAAAPFDLAQGPLFRGKVIKLAEQEHILMLNMNHIISDGWSIGVLLKEAGLIMEAYRQGREPELAPLPIQYVDYSVWQRSWLEDGGVLKQQLTYWEKKLAGVPESIDLATDCPRPSIQSFAGATYTFALDTQLTQQLKTLAEGHGSTLYMTLLAAFKVLLHRYTGQNDLCVGSPIANRQYGETEGLIGMFINTLALRSQVEGDDTFSAFLSQVKATCLEAYEHQDTPFEKIVDMLRPERNLSISPVFQVMVILQNADMGIPNQQVQQYPVESGISKFDLTVGLMETSEGLAGSIEYSTALYRLQTIHRMAEHFTALCRAITATPTARIRDLDYISDSEKRQLLVGYNDTRAEYPKDKCIHQLFAEQVAIQPEETAVVFGKQSLSYQELYTRSCDLALYLQSLGVKPDSLVGLCLERSLDMMVGIMGIVQAGGAYVPLDPNHPEERLAYMLEDSRATIVLTQEALQEKLGKLIPSDTQLMVLDRQRAEISDRVEELKAKNIALAHEVKPHHLAYVIYTSGSTGKPKGVAIEHHSPVTLVHWASEVYSREELAGVLAATSICFDLSVYEIFVTLANGGTIFLVANALGLVHLAQKESVTLINTVPSAMEELVRIRAIPDSVQTINLAGEPLSAALVDKIYDNSRVKKVYDLYGPSEDTTYSTYILRKKHAPQSIGRPIANTQIYILDAYNQLQPIGVPGELHIAGDGLARGYLNRAELTQEKFVANPFEPGTRMYKTGDLARWLDDGNIQYLGRIDTQVKIRGFRIETGEIEARLNEYPEIQESAVIVQGEESNKHLIAFYKAKGSTGENTLSLSKEGLREHLLQTLPEYMVPAAFVSLAAIPLNPNGKVDRRALSRMDVSMESGQEYEAPRSETEKQLVEIWAQVLKLAPEKIGIHDNFFELGGHSLLATQLISKIRSQMNVDLPLKVLFERTSIAHFAELVAGAERRNLPAIRPVDRTKFERLPLSFAQERVWFIHQLEPGSAGYNLSGAFLFRGKLNISQLEQAFNHIIARHENLRTVFPSIDGQAQQVILESVDFKLERMDLSHYETVEARDQKAKEICQAEAAAPFDLAQGPLFRGKVIKLAEQEHILMLNMNHIISDGWSIGVLLKEAGLIMEAYRQGREPELAPLPIQYVDYSVWQRSWLEDGGVLKQQLTYWEKKLAGVPESIDLATDCPRPSIQSFAGATYTFALDTQLTQQLKTLAEGHGSTLYMTLLAAFKVLLHRYTGQNDLCVGSPIANRQYGETEGLIGMFINTLALRSQVEGDDTFSAFLSQVKATCLEAYEHQDTPFEKIVDMLRPERNLSISPVFQVMVILQNADMGIPNQQVQQYPVESGISKFDLTVGLMETSEGLAGSIEYSTALYRLQTIHRMAEHFTALCRAITATPTARIRDLDYISDSEKRQLLVGYNDTRAEYPKDKCIHQLFAEQVAIQPEETAVVFGKQSLSYQELYTRSCDLALYLQSLGVKPDSLVGLCLERSLDMMVGIMGIVQAGGAYMPADPDYPDDRLAYMLQNSQAAIVLTQEKFRNRIGALLIEGAKLIALDKQWPEISKSVADLRARNVALRHEVKPHNVNYVIYTSGSTGKPKGVQVEHQALVNRIHWMQKRYPLQQNDVVLQKTPYSFDVSVWEFFWPMMAGASIVFAAPDGHKDVDYLEILINQANVTTLHYVPSMLRIFLEHAQGKCDCVKQIFCSGEALDKKSVEDYKTKFPNAVLHNLYGPTEAAIDVTAYDCSQLQYPFVPIGAPIDNTQIYILDAYNQLQPIGVPGELHIAGDGLARGYLNRAELTQEKFVANPFEPGTRMYKTGDLARWLDDGNIQYLGRIDTQVKIRGFRIETGEIEARLNEYPEIQESAVIVQGEESNKHLIAFYKAKGSTGENTLSLSKEGLREHLLQTLPEYMVPAAFVSLAAIPLNPNGKVDRCALSRMDVSMESGQEYEAPRSETEKQLVEIWAQVLKLAPEKIGIHDNFFELGGHSLAAVQLMAKVNRRFEQLLPLATMFIAPNIATFAKLIEAEEAPPIDILVPIQNHGSALPVFGVPGAGGNVLSLQSLSKVLGEQQPFYGLQAVGLDGKNMPLKSVEQTAQANIEALKNIQPSGPYSLIGHSYGGVVAYEMARVLLEQGEEISSLILLDSIAPSIMQEQFGHDDVADLFEVCMAAANLCGANVHMDKELLQQLAKEESVQPIVALLNDCGLAINGEQFTAFYSVYQANLLCYRTYKPLALSRDIDVSLYRAMQVRHERPTIPHDYGWAELLRRPLHIHDVEADHFSLLEKVHIQEVAKVLAV